MKISQTVRLAELDRWTCVLYYIIKFANTAQSDEFNLFTQTFADLSKIKQIKFFIPVDYVYILSLESSIFAN